MNQNNITNVFCFSIIDFPSLIAKYHSKKSKCNSLNNIIVVCSRLSFNKKTIMEIVNIHEYFFNRSKVHYNSLIHNFPDFHEENFTEFLCENEDNPKLVNYYLHEIYPVLKNGEDLNIISSRIRLIRLLHSLSSDALIFLWKEKINKFFDWYQTETVIDSYFECLEQEKIINMINYLYNLELHKESYPIYYVDAMRLAAGLMIFLSEESISSFSSHEYFIGIFKNFEILFSEKEIEIFLKKKPDLINLLKIENNESSLRYYSTLHISDRADMESFVNILKVEYEENKIKVRQGFGNTQGNFYIKDNRLKIKFDYIIEIVKMFDPSNRTEFLSILFKEDFINEMVTPTQKETLEILVKENFKSIQGLQDLRKN
jgi:hypothetical protein